MSSTTFVRYHPRPIAFHGVRDVHGQRLKVYSIRYGAEPLHWGTFEPGLSRAFAELPEPDIAAGRPGLGFVIVHQGRTGDYVILAWWDNENELPLRVFVRDQDGWRTARPNESVCVWDLEVIWHERQAYVATVLSVDSSDIGAVYLACTLVDF
jgi:hypothetical protein